MKIKVLKNSQKSDLKFYVEVGSEETGGTSNGKIFIETKRRLHEVLKFRGYPVNYIEVKRCLPRSYSLAVAISGWDIIFI